MLSLCLRLIVLGLVLATLTGCGDALLRLGLRIQCGPTWPWEGFATCGDHHPTPTQRPTNSPIIEDAPERRPW